MRLQGAQSRKWNLLDTGWHEITALTLQHPPCSIALAFLILMPVWLLLCEVHQRRDGLMSWCAYYLPSLPLLLVDQRECDPCNPLRTQMVVMVDVHELPAQQLSMDLSKPMRRAALREQLAPGYALVLPILAISDAGGASDAAKVDLAKDLISGAHSHHHSSFRCCCRNISVLHVSLP